MGNRISLTFQFMISIIIFYIIMKKLNLEIDINILLNLKINYLIVAILIFSLQVFFLVVKRWEIICDYFKIKIPFKNLFIFSIAGLTLRQAVPNADEGYRIIALKLNGYLLSISARCVIVDKLSGLLGIILFMFVFHPITYIELGVTKYSIISSLIILSIFLLFFLIFKLESLNNIIKLNKIKKILKIIKDDGFLLFGLNKLGFKSLVYSLIIQLTVIFQFYFIFLACDVDIKIFSLIVVIPIVMLLISLPISFGGWGLREGSMILGFQKFGYPSDEVFVCSLIFGLINLCAGLICLPSLFYLKK